MQYLSFQTIIKIDNSVFYWDAISDFCFLNALGAHREAAGSSSFLPAIQTGTGQIDEVGQLVQHLY